MSDDANSREGVNAQLSHWIDRREQPTRVFSGKQSYDISADERVPGLFRWFKDDACRHEFFSIVRRFNASGHEFFTRYCSGCGVKVGGHVKREDAHRIGVSERTQDEMEALADRYIAERQAQFDRIVEGAVERLQEDRSRADEEWQARYQDYLRSPQWKRKVDKIMRRAEGTCEGCLGQPAEEVHHLTYRNVFEEFAFQLVALCSPCHRRYHAKDVG